MNNAPLFKVGNILIRMHDIEEGYREKYRAGALLKITKITPQKYFYVYLGIYADASRTRLSVDNDYIDVIERDCRLHTKLAELLYV